MTQDNFVPYGHDDILIIAIGKLEYAGRVRATGFGVIISQYFGMISRGSNNSSTSTT